MSKNYDWGSNKSWGPKPQPHEENKNVHDDSLMQNSNILSNDNGDDPRSPTNMTGAINNSRESPSKEGDIPVISEAEKAA